MPYEQVMHKFKHGQLKSGSGQKVKNRKQAIAIMLSEKRKGTHSSDKVGPSKKLKDKHGIK